MRATGLKKAALRYIESITECLRDCGTDLKGLQRLKRGKMSKFTTGPFSQGFLMAIVTLEERLKSSCPEDSVLDGGTASVKAKEKWGSGVGSFANRYMEQCARDGECPTRRARKGSCVAPLCICSALLRPRAVPAVPLESPSSRGRAYLRDDPAGS